MIWEHIVFFCASLPCKACTGGCLMIDSFLVSATLCFSYVKFRGVNADVSCEMLILFLSLYCLWHPRLEGKPAWRECISNRNNVWCCEVESELSCYRDCSRGCLHEHLRRNRVYSLTVDAASSPRPPVKKWRESHDASMKQCPTTKCGVRKCKILILRSVIDWVVIKTTFNVIEKKKTERTNQRARLHGVLFKFEFANNKTS